MHARDLGIAFDRQLRTWLSAGTTTTNTATPTPPPFGQNGVCPALLHPPPPPLWALPQRPQVPRHQVLVPDIGPTQKIFLL